MKISKRTKYSLIENDEFHFIINDYKYLKDGKTHTITYSDFQYVIDKFIQNTLEKDLEFENLEQKKSMLKFMFDKYMATHVKFRECLKCSKDFLSISIGNRVCFHCKHYDSDPFILYSAWGDTLQW